MTDEQGDRLLDAIEVAAMLGVEMDTITKWRARKAGPEYYKLGPRLIRYRESDIIKFLAASRVRHDR